MVSVKSLSAIALLVTLARTSGFGLSPHAALISSATENRQVSALLERSSQHANVRQRRPLCMMSFTSAETGVVDNPEPQPSSASGGKQEPANPVMPEKGGSELATYPSSTVFVAGGSGFVGSEVCRQLVEAGCNVIALSRKGAPDDGDPWVGSVRWIKGNALNQDAYRAELRKSDKVVSCVGGFGKTGAYMDLVNGEANIKLAEAAADAGVKQFIYVSVHDFRAPNFVKRVGYFSGKRRTERVVGELFGAKGVILKPAFIYGERKVKVKGPGGKERGFKLPLQRVGRPLERIASTRVGKRIAESGLPLADLAWTQPLSRDSVARSAVRCCLEAPEEVGGGRGRDSGDAVVLRVQDIVQLVA